MTLDEPLSSSKQAEKQQRRAADTKTYLDEQTWEQTQTLSPWRISDKRASQSVPSLSGASVYSVIFFGGDRSAKLRPSVNLRCLLYLMRLTPRSFRPAAFNTVHDIKPIQQDKACLLQSKTCLLTNSSIFTCRVGWELMTKYCLPSGSIPSGHFSCVFFLFIFFKY